jgi:TonB family protein
MRFGRALVGGLVSGLAAVGFAAAQPAAAPSARVPSPREVRALRPTIDVYAGALLARLQPHLPSQPTAPGGPGGPGGPVSATVRVLLTPEGLVSLATIERASGVPAFDAAVLDVLSRFQGQVPGSLGRLPVPVEPNRQRQVTTEGFALEVRPAPLAAPSAPGGPKGASNP